MKAKVVEIVKLGASGINFDLEIPIKVLYALSTCMVVRNTSMLSGNL